MNLAGSARIAAYAVAVSIVGVTVLVAREPSRGREAFWPAAIERAQAALASGDAGEARRLWEDAYRDAVQRRTAAGLLAVGHLSLQIGDTTHDRQAATAEARRIFLLALLQAREDRDPDGVALAGRAFADLGDRDVAARAFEIALALAIAKRDADAHARVTALARQASSDGVRALPRAV
jgi:tetratricopeptide (TPR) repeat protein